MKSKLEALMDLSPRLPGEPDMNSLVKKPAFSSEAAAELLEFVDNMEARTWDGSIISRAGRISVQHARLYTK